MTVPSGLVFFFAGVRRAFLGFVAEDRVVSDVSVVSFLMMTGASWPLLRFLTGGASLSDRDESEFASSSLICRVVPEVRVGRFATERV